MLVRDCRPREGDENELLVLTTAHLFLDVPDEAPVAWAPPNPIEPQQSDARDLGTLRRRVPLTQLPHIAVDAAVIKPEHVECGQDVAGGLPRGMRDLWAEQPEEPIAVRKHGAKTGITQGTLMPVNVDHVVSDVNARYTMGWFVEGEGELFATRGDSGAIVVDENRMVVGMAVAVEKEGTDPQIGCFVHGIRQIFQALEVEPL